LIDLQVELNTAWQQKKLRAYCAEKGIHVAAYSPLGGQKWSGSEANAVLGSEVLAEIAKARGKSIAQVRNPSPRACYVLSICIYDSNLRFSHFR
jgi:diketogulonate reductase-like aldo/keto reductase